MVRINLYKYLRERDVTQKQLSQDTGCSTTFINKLALDKKVKYIEIANVEKICKYFDITFSDLFEIID